MAKFLLSADAGVGSSPVSFHCPTTAETSGNTEAYYDVAIGNDTHSTVTVKQWGRPEIYKVSGDNPISYSGGQQTWHFTSTHYGFKMENRPSWLTITDSNGRFLSSGNWYFVQDIYLTAAPSTTNIDRNTYEGANPFRILMGDTGGTRTVLPTINQNGLPEDEPVLTVSPTAHYWDWDDTNTKMFLVSHTAADFAYEADETDYAFYKGGSTLYLTPYAENTSSSNKNTYIDITTTDTDGVTVLARHYLKPSISCSKSQINGNGEMATVVVTSANDWYLDGVPNYVTVTKNGATITPSSRQSGNAAAQNLIFTFAENTGSSRTATITLHYYSSDDNTDTTASWAVLTFSQGEATEDLTVSVSPTAIPQSGITVSATVTSDKVWWFNTQQGNWSGVITEAATGNRVYPLQEMQPTSNAVFYMPTNANNTDSGVAYRVALFYEGASHSIFSEYLTQEGVDMTITGGSCTFPASPLLDICSISVSSNVAFSIDTTNVPWVSVSPTAGTIGNTTVRITASSNPGTYREGSIIFVVGGNNVHSHYVSQEGAVTVEWSSNPDYFDIGGEMNQYSLFVYPADTTTVWYALASDSWITIENDTTHTGNGEVTFTVSDNTSGEYRNGWIDIVSGSEDLMEIHLSVTIGQAEADE